MSERPGRDRPRRLADWLNPTGEKKVHSLVDKVYKRKDLELAWLRVRSERGPFLRYARRGTPCPACPWTRSSRGGGQPTAPGRHRARRVAAVSGPRRAARRGRPSESPGGSPLATDSLALWAVLRRLSDRPPTRLFGRGERGPRNRLPGLSGRLPGPEAVPAPRRDDEAGSDSRLSGPPSRPA
jgi:hypothetical protein